MDNQHQLSLENRIWRVVAAAAASLLATGSVIAQEQDKKIAPANKTTTLDQTHAPGPSQKKPHSAPAEDTHNGKAHFTAFNLYKEGQQLEKSGDFAKAAEVYQQALTAMVKQKHDPKFHLKIETALSRVKAKAGINQ
jgi:hypothetical protein